MSSIATSTHLPALSEPGAREQAGIELDATVRDLVALSLIGKQLHWAAVGAHFRAVHEQLDEFVDAWKVLADTVAERAVALGHVPDGQAAAVSAAGVAPVERAPLSDPEVVRAMAHRVAEVSEAIRTRMDRLGDIDLASQDVLVGVVRELEQQQWMLRAQLSA